MALATDLTRKLDIRHPILLAPMDLVSDAKLTAAVSTAGAFGVLGGGYGDETWLRTQISELTQLGLGPGSSFGIGFITWSLARQPELLDIALEARPRAIMLSFGDPKPFARRIRQAGALVICQIQDEKMAEAALEARADIIVAQGTEAGGHGSSRGTLGLVPAVVDLAAGRAMVVAAGGVADGRGLAACLMLGASGILMGSRFYASEEAEGPAAAKERIRTASGDETIRGLIFDISRQNVWPEPFTGRCLLNDHARKWTGREIDLMRNARAEAGAYEKAKADGNFDVAAVIAGEAAGLIDDIPKAAVIVERMVAEAEQLLASQSNFAHVETG